MGYIYVIVLFASYFLTGLFGIFKIRKERIGYFVVYVWIGLVFQIIEYVMYKLGTPNLALTYLYVPLELYFVYMGLSNFNKKLKQNGWIILVIGVILSIPFAGIDPNPGAFYYMILGNFALLILSVSQITEKRTPAFLIFILAGLVVYSAESVICYYAYLSGYVNSNLHHILASSLRNVFIMIGFIKCN